MGVGRVGQHGVRWGWADTALGVLTMSSLIVNLTLTLAVTLTPQHNSKSDP